MNFLYAIRGGGSVGKYVSGRKDDEAKHDDDVAWVEFRFLLMFSPRGVRFIRLMSGYHFE